MKCPKCGFNSFEYYNNCKKCSADLTGYKQTYSISALVLPQEAKTRLAAEFRSNENTTGVMPAAPEVHDDIFSFDLPDDSPRSPSRPADDPFNFDEPVSATPQANSAALEDDIFGDLLESTPQAEVPTFTAQHPAGTESAVPSTSGSGEFDFNNFSWDDSPSTPAASGDAADSTDDFDSFFEDPKEKSSK